jgi:hypothetical protein
MMGRHINLSAFVGATVSVCWLLSASSGTYISGEEAIGSPLRVAQCRAQCLQAVSSKLTAVDKRKRCASSALRLLSRF